MVQQNTESQRTAFLVTVRLRPRHHHGHLGVRPGGDHHRARRPGRRGPATWPGPATSSRSRLADGGVLRRAGHTEAAVDLARLAGVSPGRGAGRDRRREEDGHGPRPGARAVLRGTRAADDLDRRPRPLPAPDREADPPDGRGADPHRVGRVHVLRVRVDPRRRRISTSRSCGATSTGEENVLVRVHSECLTGDVFGSLRCDCGPQLASAMEKDRRGGPRGRRLPDRSRGARDRAGPQDPGLQPPGAGARHGRRQRRARAADRQPQVRHRRPDPGRPGHHHDAVDDQQRGQVRRPRRATA